MSHPSYGFGRPQPLTARQLAWSHAGTDADSQDRARERGLEFDSLAAKRAVMREEQRVADEEFDAAEAARFEARQAKYRAGYVD